MVSIGMLPDLIKFKLICSLEDQTRHVRVSFAESYELWQMFEHQLTSRKTKPANCHNVV